MRELKGHVVNPVNDKIRIQVSDEPGAGGANHRYEIFGFNAMNNPSRFGETSAPLAIGNIILFQNGPIGDVGANGVTQEVLLEIVADRLRSFQKGPFTCKENACALTHIEEAMHWLQQRTIERMRRGVEGTNIK